MNGTDWTPALAGVEELAERRSPKQTLSALVKGATSSTWPARTHARSVYVEGDSLNPRRRTLLLLVSLATALALAPATSWAEPLEDRAFGPDASQLAARSTLERRFRTQVDVSWDRATGTPAVVRFHPPVRLARGAKPERAARLLLQRLARLYGVRGLGAPSVRGHRLPCLGVKGYGPWIVARFAQRVGATPVDGSVLKVVMSRKAGALVAVSLAGRVYKDLPTLIRAAPRAPTLPGESESSKALGLDVTPRLVFSPRGGLWRFGFSQLRVEDGQAVRVLVDANGEVLDRRPGAFHAVRGKIFPRGPRDWRSRETIRDLYLPDGKVPSTLSGPFETVESSARPHASTGKRRGDLLLDYRSDDPRIDELNVFYHLVETRRWLDQYRRILGDAHRNLVVARFNAPVNNAFAQLAPVQVHGRAGHRLMFGWVNGVSTARDASIVTHERGHVLLYQMGFLAVGTGESGGIHEAYADYLAAARLGDPVVAEGLKIGWARRDISVRKVWPQDGGEVHRDGWIYAGALWDARGELGARAMDRIAFGAVPLFYDGMTLLQGRDATLQVDERLNGGRNAEALKMHFLNHGIGREDKGQPPVIEPEKPGAILEPGASPETFKIVATDPDGKPVGLSVSRLEFVDVSEPTVEDGKTTVEVTVRYDAAYAGVHELTVLAEDADGDQAVASLFFLVQLAKASIESKGGVTYRLSVGETKTVPLSEVVPEDQGDTYRRGNFWLAGSVGGLAHLRRGRLVIEAREGDQGTHEFFLRASPRGAVVFDSLQVPVKVVVGSGPEVVVKRGGAVVQVGQSVGVHGGSTLDLSLKAHWDVGGRAEETLYVEPGETPQSIALEVVEAPPGVTLTPRDYGVHVRSRNYADATLLVETQADVAARTLVVRLKATRSDGVSVTRTLRVDVLPTANRAPTLEAPEGVELTDVRGEALFKAQDPEGQRVLVEVNFDRERIAVELRGSQLSPSPGDPPSAAQRAEPGADGPFASDRLRISDFPSLSGRRGVEGELVFRWLKPEEDGETTVVLRAVDAYGMQTSKVIEVAYTKPASATDQTEEIPDDLLDLVEEQLREAQEDTDAPDSKPRAGIIQGLNGD